MAGLPNDIAQFMDACIPSLELLEVLLWLRQHKHGTSQAVAKVMATSHHSILRGFAHLTRCGLARVEGDGVEYAATTQLSHLIDRLADEYMNRRLEVIHHLYGRSRSANTFKDFADAFIIRPVPPRPGGDP
jgi:hypothetical protein